MIPIYRAGKMEPAVNLMAKHIRNVLVDTSLWVRPNITIRSNMIDCAVYFDRVPSQGVLWQNNGGVLIRRNRNIDYDNDAIFFCECPRSIEILDRAARLTRSFVVVYQPPTWRPFFDTVEKRFALKSEKQRYIARANLERVHQLLESSEIFTPRTLARILLVRQGQIPRPSSAPGLPSDEERSADMLRGAP